MNTLNDWAAELGGQLNIPGGDSCPVLGLVVRTADDLIHDLAHNLADIPAAELAMRTLENVNRKLDRRGAHIFSGLARLQMLAAIENVIGRWFGLTLDLARSKFAAELDAPLVIEDDPLDLPEMEPDDLCGFGAAFEPDMDLLDAAALVAESAAYYGEVSPWKLAAAACGRAGIEDDSYIEVLAWEILSVVEGEGHIFEPVDSGVDGCYRSLDAGVHAGEIARISELRGKMPATVRALGLGAASPRWLSAVGRMLFLRYFRSTRREDYSYAMRHLLPYRSET